MVRIAASFIGAALAFSSAVYGAPAVKRQGDINVAIPAGGAAAEPGLDQINLNGVNTAGAVDPSLGSVQFPGATDSVPVVPPVETVAPQPVPPQPVPQPIPPQPIPSIPQPVPSWPQYGSGSITWHPDYNGCVEQCFVSHPAPPTVIQLPPSGVVVAQGQGQVFPPSGNGVDIPPQVGGNGVEHRIIIEATSGSIRYVPAFVTAAVGDSITFVNQNGAHSVVSSAAVLPCNSTGEFDSGILQPGGTFTHIVRDTEPQFFFSSVNNDCQVGLFGAINAATGLEGAPGTFNAVLPGLAEQNPDISAALAATNTLAANTGGLNWGGKIDVSQIPPELLPQLAGNILFTRNAMGLNPDQIDENGAFRPQGELIVPQDLVSSFAVADAGGYDYPTDSETASDDADNATPESANLATDTDGSNGAGSILSSRVAVAGVAVLAALFMF